MLRGEFADAGGSTPEELLSAYRCRLEEPIDDGGVDAVARELGVDRDLVAALASGNRPEVTLEQAAAILATDGSLPDAETIAAEARDMLLMGMSTAVLDVEAIQSGIDAEMEAKEIQQKVEGRQAMTLAEYARLHQFIESRKR